MWRGNFSNESERITNFKKQTPYIEKIFANLEGGNIKKIIVFPYTENFLIQSLKSKFIKNYCFYRNPVENEFDKYIKNYNKKEFFIIRPFLNKKNIKKYGIKYLINYSKKIKNIKKIIFSCSSIKQLNQIIS